MKLFDILNSEHKREENDKNTVNVIAEIDTIIAVMDNLGLLDSKKIEKNLNKENVEYDKSILKRLMISMDERKIQVLKKYYSPATIGYGSLKLREIKQQLIEKSIKLSKLGKNKLEIIEELISYSQIFIDEYKDVLEDFNDTIELIEKRASTKSELFALMEYWFNDYRVERLGYIPDIDNAIQTMVKDLESLPYGGYGDKEMAKFKDEAIEIVQYGKANQEEANIILNNITKKLFEPRKNKYNTDLQALKRKIELIRSSNSITNEQKTINVRKAIAEFNALYGHALVVKEEENKHEKVDNSIFLIEVNIQKLLNISNGRGYGSSAIAYYRKKCDEVMDSTLDDAEKYVQINKIADSLIEEYNYNEDLFYRWKEAQLQKLSEEERIAHEPVLENQVLYMLSLSPIELKKYLVDDSKNKKEMIDKHNQKVVVSYLARKEASSKNDEGLYDIRIQEYKNGNIPYSQKEYDNAYDILLLDSLIEKNESEDRIINAVEYVDSTLVQQIFSLGEKKTVTAK